MKRVDCTKISVLVHQFTMHKNHDSSSDFSTPLCHNYQEMFLKMTQRLNLENALTFFPVHITVKTKYVKQEVAFEV